MGIVSEFRSFIKIKGTRNHLQPPFTRSILRPPRFEIVKGTGIEVNDLTSLESTILDDWAEQSSDDSEISWDSETSPPIFCEPGDSGSFVIASTRFTYGGYSNRVAMPSTNDSLANIAAPMPFVVGLLWGHSQNGNVSWMVPFDAVKQEIENLTGETMVWPEKRTDYLKELEQSRIPDPMDLS